MAAPTITYYEDDGMIEKCGHSFKMITGTLVLGVYETDGVAFDLSKKLPTKVHQVILDQMGGYTLVYDYSNKKIKAFYGDYSEGTDAVLVEVANGVNMASACGDVRFTAIGK